MTYRRKDDLVMRRIADEAILVPVAANVGNLESVFTLTPVGSYIWEQIDGRSDGRRIADLVCEEYDVEPDAAASDVEEFLEKLEAAGLIEPTGDTDAD